MENCEENELGGERAQEDVGDPNETHDIDAF